MSYKCEDCNLEFKTFQAKANHIRWKHKDQSAYIQKMKDLAPAKVEKQYGKMVSENVNCHLCNKSISIEYREGKKKDIYFCSRSCANTRIHSEETKKEIAKSTSIAIKEKWTNGDYDNVQIKRFSSKREREILKYFKDNYPDDEWTSGGCIKYKNENITRDMYSKKLKICFEYDGIWHFKDIKGQLKTKQLKDYLLEEWCLKNNYRLIRVEDGFENTKLIEDLIYNNKEQIIKIGESYSNPDI